MVMTMLEGALFYADRGLPVFPCSPNSKIPLKDSHGSKDATTDEAKIREWWGNVPTANVAIATGSVSGLYVVDVDAESSPIMPRLPETWIARTRGGGWHYVYATDEALPNTGKGSPNALSTDVDTRGEGGYILVWPSIFDGKGYEWINDVDPAPLPQWVADKVRPKQTMTVYRPMLTAATSWAERALQAEIDAVAGTAPGGRNHALARSAFKLGQIAGAGHMSLGVARDALVAVAREWPQPRKSISTIERALNAGSLKPRSPVSQAAPLALDYYVDDDDDAPEVLQALPLPPKKPSGDARRLELLRDVRDLGGLCDSFSGWVIRGADHPQPGLTIGALLALGSAMFGRRLVYRRSTSSLYVVSMAASGEGKNRPQSCLSRVIDDVWPDLRGPNSFSSGPAFTDSLRRATINGTATCLVLDEYGMQLQGMIGPRAAAHRQDIKHSLTELSTKGVDKWSPALSLVKGGGKIDLIAPVVSLLGSTTPESLHSVLTSTDVADGFVGRHVWMRAQDVLPEWQPPEERGDDEIPIDVRAAVMAVRERHEAWHLALPVTQEGIDPLRLYDPLTVPEDDDARTALTDCKVQSDDLRRRGASEIPHAVLARLPEFAARLSLILAALSQPEAPTPRVTGAVAALAIRLAQESADTLAASLMAHRRPSWDDHEGQVDYVLGLLTAAGGGMRRTDLLRSARRLSARSLDDVLHRLIEEGQIREIADAGKTRPMRVYQIV